MIINGDSLQVLKTYSDNHFDSVVTDPPYGLSFMGKKWDYDVPTKELWEEVFRVLKPGGHLLAFAGTRTYHRMAVAIEDAGFEIRDMIEWVYGSGFPKSLNIGKAVDKLQGNKRVEVPSKRHGGGSSDIFPERNNKTDSIGNSKLEGWGTALKPAHEPCVLARKPIDGNVAQNCLKYGVGGLNIDGSRVGNFTNTQASGVTRLGQWASSHDGANRKILPETVEIKQGRFPANLIHDGSDEVLEVFPKTSSEKRTKIKAVNPRGKIDLYGDYGNALHDTPSYPGGGSAARFFYCAKSSKSERNAGLDGFANTHPTIKPVRLMQYLVRLVTPKGGICLDPFNGSGTTGIACKLEGMEYLGIELDPEYVKISEARIAAWEPEQQVSLL